MENDEIENVNESTSEVVETQEEIKTYTQEEVDAIREQMKADNQKAWDKRWGREKSKLEKQYAEKDELINLLKEQTGAEDLNNLINMSYSQYGIDRPTKSNRKDDEILGKYDAKEILELDDEIIEEEANRLASISKRSAREEATFMELENYLTNKQNTEKIKKEIKENGIDEEVLEDSDFKKFMEKFNKDTSIADIYDLYNKVYSEPKQKPFSAGSVKGKLVKEEQPYFTVDEYNALTSKDLENPKIYEKAMKTMNHFYQK